MTGTQLAGLRSRTKQFLQKNRILLGLFLLGLLLALLPGKKTEAEQTDTRQAELQFDRAETQQELEQILSGIEGAGRVRLMLTLATGEKTIYQTDNRSTVSADDTTRDVQTVFRQTGSSTKEPLVQSVLCPQYQGALVVCDGAELASVRLAITQAVSNLTGLGSNKIAVVKMKAQ